MNFDLSKKINMLKAECEKNRELYRQKNEFIKSAAFEEIGFFLYCLYLIELKRISIDKVVELIEKDMKLFENFNEL